jgi:hypothetical protein
MLISQCMVAGQPNRVLTVGAIAFTNTGPASIIDKVSLRNPRRLALLSAYVLPITGHDTFATGQGYPSSAMDAPGVHWAQRRRASGAVIPHSRPPRDTDLVLVLKLLGKKSGTSDGVDIYYHTSGQNYHFFQTIRFTVVAGWHLPCN